MEETAGGTETAATGVILLALEKLKDEEAAFGSAPCMRRKSVRAVSPFSRSSLSRANPIPAVCWATIAYLLGKSCETGARARLRVALASLNPLSEPRMVSSRCSGVLRCLPFFKVLSEGLVPMPIPLCQWLHSAVPKPRLVRALAKRARLGRSLYLQASSRQVG